MKLTFLGSGSAFTVGDNFHSNMIVESGSKKKILIDCGSDARHSLAKIGLSSRDIDAVYISHLHADHSGGLEWLAFTRKFNPPFKKPNLYIHEELSKPLWDEQLKASLKPLGDISGSIESYYDLNPVAKSFEWEGIQFELIRSRHIQDAGKWVPSFGLRFQLNGRKIFITTDTQFFPEALAQHYSAADLIFHDCETSNPPSGVHSSYLQLKSLPTDVKEKIWLYHYNPGPLPNATADGFLGFVKCGQTFDF